MTMTRVNCPFSLISFFEIDHGLLFQVKKRKRKGKRGNARRRRKKSGRQCCKYKVQTRLMVVQLPPRRLPQHQVYTPLRSLVYLPFRELLFPSLNSPLPQPSPHAHIWSPKAWSSSLKANSRRVRTPLPLLSSPRSRRRKDSFPTLHGRTGRRTTRRKTRRVKRMGRRWRRREYSGAG